MIGKEKRDEEGFEDCDDTSRLNKPGGKTEKRANKKLPNKKPINK